MIIQNKVNINYYLYLNIVQIILKDEIKISLLNYKH